MACYELARNARWKVVGECSTEKKEIVHEKNDNPKNGSQLQENTKLGRFDATQNDSK